MGPSPVRIGLVAAVAATAILLFGCAKPEEKDLEPVTYRLKWLFNVSVVGSLYADMHGIFAEQGLKVTIKEGGPERDAIKELELGHAQFGAASADQVIRALSKGSPLIVIAQIFQENPLQWIFRPATVTIRTARDLKGKTIGVTFGGNDETIMNALMSRFNIPKDQVGLFSVRFDYAPFYQGKVDLWPVYQNAEGVVIGEKMRRAGEQVQFFNPAAAGIHFVANSVVTTERILRERPVVVRKFATALLRGWQEALNPENRKKAVETIRQFDRDTPVDIIPKQLEATTMLVQPSPGTQIGEIDEKAWRQTESIMLEQKLIPSPVHVEKALLPWGDVPSKDSQAP